jgi:hypothetical protein
MIIPTHFPPGSVATHEGCDVPIETFECNLVESALTMGRPHGGGPFAPVVDAEPWNAREIPIRYETTFQPCGHAVSHSPAAAARTSQ